MFPSTFLKRASLVSCCSALAVLGLGAIAPKSANAAAIVLDFEGLQDGEALANFYNGGQGGLGSGPGANFGIQFSGDAVAIIDQDAGGSGNFGGEPSPDTTLGVQSGSTAVLNIASGFDTGIAFFFSNPFGPSSVNVYENLNASGTVLAALNLISTPGADAQDPTGDFSPLITASTAFSGTARSVSFSGNTGGVDPVLFDNVGLGTTTPVSGPGSQEIPSPALLPGLIGMGVAALRKRKAEAEENA